MRVTGVTRKLFLLAAMMAVVSIAVVAGLSWRMRHASAQAQLLNESAGARTYSLLMLTGTSFGTLSRANHGS